MARTILLAGFPLPAIRVIGPSPAGWAAAVLWAAVMTLTGVGAAHGLTL